MEPLPRSTTPTLTPPTRSMRRTPLRRMMLLVVLLLVCGLVGLFFWQRWAFQHTLSAVRSHEQLGHHRAAVVLLEPLIKADPRNPELRLLSIRLAWRSGEAEQAAELLDSIWATTGDTPPVVLERLLVEAARGEFERTGPILLQRARIEPELLPTVRYALVSGMLRQYRWVDAYAVLNSWLADSPQSPLPYLLRGKLEEQRDLTDEATKTFREVLQLDPESDEARLRLSRLLVMRFRGEDALEQLTELRVRMPDHPEVLVLYARALGLQARTDEQRAALSDCLTRFPDHPTALAERGRLRLQENDLSGAEADLSLALRQEPGDTTIRHQYVNVLNRLGKTEAAAEEQTRITQCDDDAQRIRDLTRGRLQTHPNDPAVPHEIGMISLRAGQGREAVRWFEQALSCNPNYVPTHRMLAIYYQETDNPVLAAKHRALAQRGESSR